MDFFLGILGITQIILLPGLICTKAIKLQGNLFDKVLVIFSTSLIANYCVIFLLAILGLYTGLILGILIVGETAAILWLYRNDLYTPVQKLLDDAQNGINDIVHFFFPQGGNVPALKYFVGVVLLVLSARTLLWSIAIFIQNLGTVFNAWDAVVSWNNWATTWSANQIPMDSRFYPQLIPINWSITYILPGSTSVQFFAKAIMPLFAMMLLLGFFSLAIDTKKHYFLISLILSQPLLNKFISSGIDNGYVDIAVTYFVFAAIYALFKAREVVEQEQRNRWFLLGALFSAGAAITKQTGVYFALCYPVLVIVSLLLTRTTSEKKLVMRLFSSFAIISLLWGSWYVFKEIQILTGTDYASMDTYVSLTAARYESASIIQQIATAIGQYRELVVLFLLIIISFPWMDRFHKALTILFAPYPVLWAWLAAYDTRNLSIFLPVLAVISGYSIAWLFQKLMELDGRIKVFRTPFYIPVALAFAALVALSSLISPQRLLQRQVDLQKQNFSPAKNEVLYDLVEENGPQTRILTNYPMDYLPGLEEYQVRFNFQDYDTFLTYIQDPKIGYMLVPNAIDERIKDHIGVEVTAGNYEVLFKDQQWRTYTLFKIVHRK